jgi:hypothetical protein
MLILGRELETVTVLVVPGSDQGFGISWTDPDGNPVGINDHTVEIVCPQFTWRAVVDEGVSRWELTEQDTNLPIGAYDGVVRVGSVTAFRVRVLVQ